MSVAMAGLKIPTTRSLATYKREVGYDYSEEVPTGGDGIYQRFSGT